MTSSYVKPLWLQRLNQKMRPFLEGKLFTALFAITIFGVAAAQASQLWRVVSAVSVEGVSAATFLLLAYNSFVGAMYGVKQLDARLVVAVGFAGICAILTAIITLLRGGSF